MLYIFATLLILAAAYVLMLQGRKGHPHLSRFSGWAYAHRGLHDSTHPENSMAAFRAALEGGYGIELDIHLLKDGSLAVIHDSSLRRTTGQEGIVEELTKEDLGRYCLEGTKETIPLFSQVLSLFDGKAPLIVELKTHNGNADALCRAACELLDGYHGDYCLESFDPRCVYWLRKHRPDLVRGQLAENFMKSKLPVHWLGRFIMTHQLANFLTRPDFIAYRFADRKALSNCICRGFWGLMGVSWTIRTPEELKAAVQEGWIPIFEGFRPE